MNTYSKRINKVFSCKKKKLIKKNNKQKSYFDKLYIRIFLSSLLLLILLGGENIFNLHISSIINQNINILPIVNLFTSIYDINDIEVSLEKHYEEIIFKHPDNIIKSSSFNGVLAIEEGIVTKITKENNLYSVTVLSEKGINYTYRDITNIDITIYSYIKKGTIIGGSKMVDGIYTFAVSIYNQDQIFSINVED